MNISTSTPPTVTVTKALIDFSNLMTILDNAETITLTQWTIATQQSIIQDPYT